MRAARPPVAGAAPRSRRSWLGSAWAAAPVWLAVAVATELCLGSASVGFAQKPFAGGVLLLVLCSTAVLVLALALGNEAVLLASVLLLAAACGLADLPLHRGDAVAFAALAGGGLLLFTEAGGAALEPAGGGRRLGRPAALHACWVVLTAAAGAAAAWLVLSLQPDLSGLGLAALILGIVAAVCLICLVGWLAATLVAGTPNRR